MFKSTIQNKIKKNLENFNLKNNFIYNFEFN